MKTICLLLCLCFVSNVLFAQKKPKKDYLVTINTSLGEMKLILHDETPLHKANFLGLIKQNFYDSLLFHRVIENFMIQGGDPNSKSAAQSIVLGNGGGNLERIPAEIVPFLFHKKGALAAARDNNPEKKSSACQFYITQGKVFNDSTLNIQAKRSPRQITDAQREVYKTTGGVPHLDGNYTVFGQLIKGFEVLDAIAHVPVAGQSNRPTANVMMKMSVELMRKRKITRKFGYKFEE